MKLSNHETVFLSEARPEIATFRSGRASLRLVMWTRREIAAMSSTSTSSDLHRSEWNRRTHDWPQRSSSRNRNFQKWSSFAANHSHIVIQTQIPTELSQEFSKCIQLVVHQWEITDRSFLMNNRNRFWIHFRSQSRDFFRITISLYRCP